MSRVFEVMSKDKKLTAFFNYKEEKSDDEDIIMKESPPTVPKRGRPPKRDLSMRANQRRTVDPSPMYQAVEVKRNYVQTTLTYMEQNFPLEQQKNDDENDFVDHIRLVMGDYLDDKETKVTFRIGGERNFKDVQYTIVGTLQQRTSTVIMLFYEALLEPIMLNEKKKIVIKFI